MGNKMTIEGMRNIFYQAINSSKLEEKKHFMSLARTKVTVNVDIPSIWTGRNPLEIFSHFVSLRSELNILSNFNNIESVPRVFKSFNHGVYKPFVTVASMYIQKKLPASLNSNVSSIVQLRNSNSTTNKTFEFTVNSAGARPR